MLSDLGYIVFINIDEKKEEQCLGDSKSNLWHNGLCMDIYHTPEKQIEIGNPGPRYGIRPLENTLVDTMTGKYEFDLLDVYMNAIECKRAYPTGEREIDVQNIAYGGDWPRCMFNIDVVIGSFKSKKWFQDFEAL